MNGPDHNVAVQKKWFRLGLAIAIIHSIFLLLIILLLQVDLSLAIAVAIIGSISGGIALLVFVLYVY